MIRKIKTEKESIFPIKGTIIIMFKVDDEEMVISGKGQIAGYKDTLGRIVFQSLLTKDYRKKKV